MGSPAELTTVEGLRDRGSYLFTARDQNGRPEEVVVVPCDEDGAPPARAYVNRCTHENQRFDTGRGVAMRDDGIICPRHGSIFEACSGHCDNGEAAGTTLPSVDVTVEDGVVTLADPAYTFDHEGGTEGDEEGPSSTSHIGF